MKFIQTLPFVALATAFVLPDVETFKQLAFEEDLDETHIDEHVHIWDETSPGAEALFGDSVPSTSSVDRDIRSAIEQLELALEDEELDNAFEAAGRPGGHHGHHGRHGHHSANLTIYQLISKSPHTTNFTKLVNEYDDIVQLLNSTKANHTLFVPINSAFENLPDHGDKKPSKEFIEAVLKYHIGLDVHSAHSILSTQTIPTALDEKFLGGEPQRLRVSVGLFGVKINFYSSVVASNFVCSCRCKQVICFEKSAHTICICRREPRTASSTP
jgi:uncharacterized surface protein with fasciclin (FAS1) repeats